MTPDKKLEHEVRLLCEAAGRAIMEIYATAFEVGAKDDASPITAADLAADRIVVEGLQRLTPGIPVISEERPKAALDFDQPFWLVDPLDGTREFVARNGEFTVNAGLIVNRTPSFGCVHIPADRSSYTGIVGSGATRWQGGTGTPIKCRTPPANGLDVVASRSHLDADTLAFLQRFKVRRTVQAGSSLKFCRIAEGAADLYPRHGPTSEWDTAAGHAVALAAGALVTNWTGGALTYGKPKLRNAGFMVTGFGKLLE